MEKGAIVATLLVLPILILSAWALAAPGASSEALDGSIMVEPPEYAGGYGFDPQTGVMEDSNGFRYSYLPDGVVRLDLPWGYTTHFSFGLTADYLGSPEIRTALDYAWEWSTNCTTAFDDEGNQSGYDYSFTATAIDGVLGWEITLDFRPDSRMKVTHHLLNSYPQKLTDVNFWWLFDLTGTATPYTIETSAGVAEGPLYEPIPDDIHWVRLANQFQFDWWGALLEYDNGHAYVGDGAVVGLDGLPILGISIELGDIAPGAQVVVDPFFSGVEKTWDAGSAGDASGPANWNPVGVPQTGDNVTFDATSTEDCNFDVEVTLGNFSMLTGYTGTVTQSVDFGCVDFTVNAGAYDKSNGVLTVEGDFIEGGDFIIPAHIELIMTGVNAELYLHNYNALLSLTVTGNCTYPNGNLQFGSGGLTVNIDSVFTFDGLLFYSLQYPTYTFSNLGEINGSGTVKFRLLGSISRAFGLINAPAEIYYSDANAIWTMIEDTTFGSSFGVSSSSAFTTTLHHGNNHELTVIGTMTLGNRGIITQGTNAWSFGSYSQTGEDSLFIQGAALTVDGDFTVSDGVFTASDDPITVAGDWDTDGFTNGDNVVTLTGDDKDIVMAAGDSFYNVTIASGANYTITDTATVDLRATIDGTLYAGDFDEPLPEFTSTGWPSGCPHTIYEYTPTQTYWDTLTLVDGPYWLHLIEGVVTGVPNENDTGVHYIVLTLTWNDMTTYQNYTIIICPELLSEAEITMLGVGLSIVLGFGLLCIGFIWKMPFMIAFSGFIWLLASVTVYKDISVGWTVISLGLGVIFLGLGGFLLVEEGEY